MARRLTSSDVGEEPDVALHARQRADVPRRGSARRWRSSAAASRPASCIEFQSEAARLIVALPPIVLGAALALTSYRRWEANQRALRLGQPLPIGGPPRLLAVGIGAVAVLVAVIVVIDAFSR